MIDRHPDVIVCANGAADVMAAVRFTRTHGLRLAVKGGGHNLAGNAVCDGGLMIDLAPMSWVRVDPQRRIARVGAGTRLGAMDHETAPYGLVVPTGVDPDTGVAGLTLGGGFGYLCRKHGLTIDNLLSVDLVTADATLVHASQDENPELFWGLRGGGGNFGVVTSFKFALQELKTVLAGLVIYRGEDARDVVRHWWKVAAEAPDELSIWLNFSTAGSEPFIPPAHRGTRVLAVVPIYSGPLENGREVLAPLRNFGEPIADTVTTVPFVKWQRAFEHSYPPGKRYYWKSHNFVDPSQEALDRITEFALSPPTPETRISVTHLGGAVKRVANDATAYPHRDADFLVNMTTRWEDPSDDGRCIGWTREYFDTLREFATGGTYVNLISEGAGEESLAYRGNYQRLARLKAIWDPTNLFRMNQNVRPARPEK
jgi:FAD/FMN-containing dehydrogenase